MRTAPQFRLCTPLPKHPLRYKPHAVFHPLEGHKSLASVHVSPPSVLGYFITSKGSVLPLGSHCAAPSLILLTAASCALVCGTHSVCPVSILHLAMFAEPISVSECRPPAPLCLWLSSEPWCGQTQLLHPCQTRGFPPRGFYRSAAVNTRFMDLFEHLFSFPWDFYLRVKLLDCKVSPQFLEAPLLTHI